MRTFRYSKEHPEGVIFDTEPGRPDPLVPPESSGWFDTPSKLVMTQDEVIASLVMTELKKQGDDRPLMEKEFQKKFGRKPHGRMSTENLIKALDDKDPQWLQAYQ